MKAFFDLFSLIFSILGIVFLLYLIYGDVKSRIQKKDVDDKHLMLYVILTLILINGIT